LADPADARGADEHHLDRGDHAVEHGLATSLERLALAAVRVALHVHVDEAQRELPGIVDLAGEEDEPRAGAEGRLALGVELLGGGPQAPPVHQLEQGGALAAGDDEPVDVRQLLGLADLDGLDVTVLQRRDVEREVALQGEDADPHPHQPRVWSSSLLSSLDVSMPGMASPRSSLTLTSTSGSL